MPFRGKGQTNGETIVSCTITAHFVSPVVQWFLVKKQIPAILQPHYVPDLTP